MIEGDGGLFDDDETVEEICFMIKVPLRSCRHSTHAHYTPFAILTSCENAIGNTTRKEVG